MEFKLNKSTWKKVKFGDVAIQLKGTVDRENSDLKYYVKGEHMNSEDIHIREFGELKDEYLGPAFIRHFKSGDILYGSRRTYLKKVAIAHIEGITSNTTFVVNAKEKVLDKRLLPFLMLSDSFTRHSIMHSKGSVNPYINWKDLADYELLLPPKAQQAELAELLWAMDEMIEKDLVVLDQLENLFKLKLKTLLDKHKKDHKLSNFFKLKNGDARPNDISGYVNEKYIYPVYGGNGVIGFSKEHNFDGETLIIGRVGEYCGNVKYSKGKIWITDNALFSTMNDSNDLKYDNEIMFIVLSYLNLNQYRNKGSYSVISGSKIYDLKIPEYNTSEINLIKLEHSTYNLNLQNVRSKIQSSKALQKTLINQLF